ncbi:bis-aminopropyl spermidine synthase family protein [Saccharopolyspora erythraea]|uniref:bis-aminopropyl spermidine synthase family protein n=1 Tax=Saccharopolyspora erythraea TaxID=1836 RepID=UPI001BACC2C1|nr:bis-aminopropyl spermidine synthase family protein [Saccharopolyspora erythraea]QUH04815.1 bis-aminopropyl spermidine synthase family protein [Saccharopolyspora erythraea]
MNAAQHDSPPTDSMQALLAETGMHARSLREVLALLAAAPRSLDDLIRLTAVPRRSVEEVISAAGDDVESREGTYRLRPDAARRYRERFALDALEQPPSTPPGALEKVREFIESGPAPLVALDHVTATAESVLRRAEWMRDHYDLDGARVLFVGDHDLTSLAVGLVCPSASVTVVDLDERVLAHIDRVAAEHGFAVRTLHTDLRFGLPPQLEADLVFTDPPYTPEGIGLFATRAAECLAGPQSRVLIAYGFSPRSPALGHKVQQELLRLGMVFEAILPDFHRYHGAQAIGSASDLYVCQPTAHTRKLALRQAVGIYTHGPQSVEARETSAPEEFLHAIGERIGAMVSTLRDPGWTRPVQLKVSAPVFDLRADPGPWLLRMLMACNTERLGLVVDNNHPDITSEAAQGALTELVAPKYELRFHRSTPDPKHAIVVAAEVDEPSSRGYLLRRAHGKVGNTWREALISVSEDLTKREARELVAERAPVTDDLDLRLIDLPRHRLRTLLRVVD